MTAAAKILQIQQTLEVEKTGYDENNEYFYFKADDVARDVRRAMNEVGLIHRTEIIEWSEDNKWDQNGRNRPRVTFRAKIIFVDPEDGSEFSTEVVATGSDTGGDKGPRKAQVQAFKIAALDLFVITEGSAFDSDGAKESEPINAAEKAPEATTISSITNEIGDRVRDSDDALTGAMVTAVTKRIAGELKKPGNQTDWKNDIQVMTQVINELRKGAVE